MKTTNRVHDDLNPIKWQLACTDITEDDEGSARFQVNSSIRAKDDPATAAASALIEGAAGLLAALERAEGWLNDTDVAYVISHDKGEQADYAGMMVAIRAAIKAAKG